MNISIKLEDWEEVLRDLVLKIAVDQAGFKILTAHDIPAEGLEFIVGVRSPILVKIDDPDFPAFYDHISKMEVPVGKQLRPVFLLCVGSLA